MPRPGIMIYFDILGPVRMLSDEDKGRLLVAMLEYGQNGIVPELEGPLGIVWSFVQPKIDRDEENYDASKLQRQYAAFCKKRKKIWMPRISFDEWVVMTDNERQRAVDPVASREPSTSTSATINHQPSTATINHQPSAAAVNINIQPTSTTDFAMLEDDGLYTGLSTPEDFAAAAADRAVCAIGGELGKGVVFLSDEQVSDLLDKMGIDAFDHYVEKLAAFILDKGAHVKSHYETILRWWREDSRLEGNL